MEGVKGDKYAPKMYENGEKTCSFAHYLAFKSLKMLISTQKYLTRYTPKKFFEEYINFKFFFLKALWSYTCSKF